MRAALRAASRVSYLQASRLQPFCSAATAADITITSSCVERLREVVGEDGVHTRLRVSVDAGGCSGFQYQFTLDTGEIGDDDRVFKQDGAEVVIDELSIGFLQGATIDYENSLVRSSFCVQENPNSDASCGCGNSFVAKDLF
eukprot:TRINITY_DN19766_c0_g1_i1.p1 TRINITY_DN19766_c0_g1~~TRINITY_DN19766_c0_g1_i1.p1  ORF type:complete len:142 (-),score=22.68 TRINITY_DN19766_c0_g1_i1:144-569(-)